MRKSPPTPLLPAPPCVQPPHIAHRARCAPPLRTNPTLTSMLPLHSNAQLCKAIPPGKVTTYGAMASALHSSARAVGQAMRRNPFAPRVPCHRVIAVNLELGGFSGSWVSWAAGVMV